MNAENKFAPNYRLGIALSMIEQNKKILNLGDIKSSPSSKFLTRELKANTITLDIRKGADKRIDFENEKLPFRNNNFDYVLAGEIFEHIFNLRSFLKEIRRVLKKNGYLVLTTPNSVSLLDRLRIIFGKLPQNGALGDYLEEHGHVRDFNWELATHYLTETGFRIVNKKTDGVIFRNRRILKYCPLSFGNTIIIKARKVR